MAFVIEPLSKRHKRDDFDCGEPALNEYLKRHARQNQERDVGRSYVATRPDDLRVLGFYTLASGAVAFERLPEQLQKKLPRYPLPVIHLARLGVDLSARGERLGETLLLDAFARALQISDLIGVHAVEVYAKTDAAKDFYLRYGFTSLPENQLNLFLPMQTIRALMDR